MTDPNATFNPQLKLLKHPLQLAAFARDEWKTPPVGIEISPTNWCNAKCDWCPFVIAQHKQAHSKEEINGSVLHLLLLNLQQMGVESITWTGGGDPSTYYQIDDAISHAHTLGIKQGMFTNAYKAISHPEYLDWIRITITEKFVITNHVKEYAKKTKVGANFNLCEENKDKLREMILAARDAGVQYFQIRPALADTVDLQKQMSFTEDYLHHLKETYSTSVFQVYITGYKFDDYLKPHSYATCHGHRFVPFVWHNGDVSVCAYHFGRKEFNFGNLYNESFQEIWEGERRRKMIEDGILVISDCQHCCKLHEINKTLAIMKQDSKMCVEDGEGFTENTEFI